MDGSVATVHAQLLSPAAARRRRHLLTRVREMTRPCPNCLARRPPCPWRKCDQGGCRRSCRGTRRVCCVWRSQLRGGRCTKPSASEPWPPLLGVTQSKPVSVTGKGAARADSAKNPRVGRTRALLNAQHGFRCGGPVNMRLETKEYGHVLSFRCELWRRLVTLTPRGDLDERWACDLHLFMS